MSKPSAPRRRVPAFTPVPLRYRKDGWTPMRQADFLGALAERGSVAAAARVVGVTRESAYRLRDHPGAQSFAAAWDALLAPRPAVSPAPMVTQDMLWTRAFYGTLKPVMRAGRHVGTKASVDNDALLRLYRRAMADRRTARARTGKPR